MIYRLGWAVWWCALALGAMCILIPGYGYFFVSGDLADFVSVAGVGLLIIGGGRLIRYVLAGD
jgi:hypothetical protein